MGASTANVGASLNRLFPQWNRLSFDIAGLPPGACFAWIALFVTPVQLHHNLRFGFFTGLVMTQGERRLLRIYLDCHNTALSRRLVLPVLACVPSLFSLSLSVRVCVRESERERERACATVARLPSSLKYRPIIEPTQQCLRWPAFSVNEPARCYLRAGCLGSTCIASGSVQLCPA